MSKSTNQLHTVSLNITDLFWPNGELTHAECLEIGFSSSLSEPSLDPRFLKRRPKIKKIIKAIDREVLIQNPDRSYVSNIFYTETICNNQKDMRELWVSSDEFTVEQLYNMAAAAARHFHPRIDFSQHFAVELDSENVAVKYTTVFKTE